MPWMHENLALEQPAIERDQIGMVRQSVETLQFLSVVVGRDANPSSTVQKVKGLIYADSGLIFAVSLHYILDDFGAGGQF